MTPAALPVIVSLVTWLSPLPQHAEGKLVRYGPDYLAHANAEYRGYDLTDFGGCGVALMSPADLGKIVWLRIPGGEWIGPCLSVDSARRVDFHRYVYSVREIAEVTDSTIAALGGFEHQAWGEVWVGRCPPTASIPALYSPPLVLDPLRREPHPRFWPYPTPETAGQCGREFVP